MIHISESEGSCKKCGKLALLGNGLCMKCWDARVDSLDYVQGNKNKHQYTMDDYQKIWFLHTVKSYSCRKISKELKLPVGSLPHIIRKISSPEYQSFINNNTVKNTIP